MKKSLLFAVLASMFAMNSHAEDITYVDQNQLIYHCDPETMTARVTGENGATGEITIPATVNAYGTDYKVTAIGENLESGTLYVFSSSTVTGITISEGITEICKGGLAACSTLEKVVLPNSLTTIGDFAFNGSTSLKAIDIPEGVKTIGMSAFLGCTSLESITIPNTVTEIVRAPWLRCPNLKSIAVASDNPVYDSRDNCNAIIATETNELVQGCQTTVIPASVTRLGYASFCGCPFTSFDIPEHITSLSSAVFMYCESLTSVSIPEGITEIGSSLFSGCSALTSVTIPQSVETIGEYAFHRTGMTTIDIPATVSSYGGYILAVCGDLTSVTVHYQDPFAISNLVFMDYDLTTWADTENIKATLYVPKGTKEKYEAADGWKNFTSIVEMDETAIDNINVSKAGAAEWYSLDGRRQDAPRKGLNIIRDSSGNMRKILVK